MHATTNCLPSTSTSLSFSCARTLISYDRWNAARALAGFLQRNPELYAGKTVLELGAGGGLPGLVAAKCGAQKVRAFCLLSLSIPQTQCAVLQPPVSLGLGI